MGLSHAVCDGTGASQFFMAMIELARGKSEPSVKPVWDRERLVGSITKQPLQINSVNEASGAVSPYLPTKVLMHECVKVDIESIRRLKISLMKESDNETFTSFESLAAYVWRSRARALNLNPDGKIMLSILVGVRKHMEDPPFPEGYYGNAVVDAEVILTVRELNERPLYEVVKLIKERKSVARRSDYVRNFINTLEMKSEDIINMQGSAALTTVTDLRHLGFVENLDFGLEELVNAVPAPCDMFGSVDLCIFSPLSKLDTSTKEGVRIFVSLPGAAMLKFKEEMEALSLMN